MPIYDVALKTVYTDSQDISFMPFVFRQNTKFYFRYKQTIKRINDLSDLFSCYQDVGLIIEPLNKYLAFCGIEVYEITKNACIVGDKLVYKESNMNNPLTFTQLAISLGLIQQKSQFTACKRKYKETDLLTFIILYKYPVKLSKRNKKIQYENGVTPELYKDRTKRGWDKELARTTPKQEAHKSTLKHSIDHLGNEFESVKNMLEYWEVSKQTFYKRKRKGLSLKECLQGEKINK